MDDALIIFIKNPVAGKVKTRLAKTIGDQAAMEVYLELLDLTQNACNKVDAARYLFYSNHIDRKDNWDEKQYLKHIQIGENLGERMQHAFDFVFNLGHKKIAIIGSDCPQISPSIINTAFKSLDKNDIVYGPSDDGGYYLKAMKKVHSFLFNDLPWSQPELLDEIKAKVEAHKLKLHKLEVLFDVDDTGDFERYKALL